MCLKSKEQNNNSNNKAHIKQSLIERLNIKNSNNQQKKHYYFLCVCQLRRKPANITVCEEGYREINLSTTHAAVRRASVSLSQQSVSSSFTPAPWEMISSQSAYVTADIQPTLQQRADKYLRECFPIFRYGWSPVHLRHIEDEPLKCNIGLQLQLIRQKMLWNSAPCRWRCLHTDINLICGLWRKWFVCIKFLTCNVENNTSFANVSSKCLFFRAPS